MSAKLPRFWRIVGRISWGLLAAPLLAPAVVGWNDARSDEHLRDSIAKGMTQTEVEALLAAWPADPPNSCQEVNGWGKQWGFHATEKDDACKQFHHMRDYHGKYAGLRVRYNARGRVCSTMILTDDEY